MATSLSEYPRPQADTGWGFHDTAGAEKRPGDPASYARYLRQELGITWFKALVSGTNKVDLARAFIQQGIEVVVRFYNYQPHPYYVLSLPEVRAYVDAGVHYIEWGNEPNLVMEWNRTAWNEGARVDKVCEQYLRNADVVRQAGGIPLFAALSPGGDYPHRDWYRCSMDWLRDHGHLADLEGAALAIHNRPFNYPLGVRAGDGCAFLEYEWIDDLVRSYVGKSLPLLGTEAGYEPGWSQVPTYPPIDLQRHAEYNVEILRCFGPNGSARWRDALFCQCMWLVESFGHRDYADAAWHANARWANGGPLPAVAALRGEWQARPFQRSWWESGKADYPQATWRGSPNYDARPAGALPAFVVLYASACDFNAAVQRLQDPASRASYHYLVSRSGAVYQLVPEASRAWHAGNTMWKERRVNDYAIAVGLINRNDGTDSYPAAQLDGAATLVRYLMTKHKIQLQDVVTTDMIRGGTGLMRFDLAAFQERLGGAPQVWPPDEAVRRAAWAASGVAYNAEAAFPRYARQMGLGNPETPEFDFQSDGRLYRGQGFSKGIVYAEIGHWNELQVKPW